MSHFVPMYEIHDEVDESIQWWGWRINDDDEYNKYFREKNLQNKPQKKFISTKNYRKKMKKIFEESSEKRFFI